MPGGVRGSFCIDSAEAYAFRLKPTRFSDGGVIVSWGTTAAEPRYNLACRCKTSPVIATAWTRYVPTKPGECDLPALKRVNLQ